MSEIYQEEVITCLWCDAEVGLDDGDYCDTDCMDAHHFDMEDRSDD